MDRRTRSLAQGRGGVRPALHIDILRSIHRHRIGLAGDSDGNVDLYAGGRSHSTGDIRLSDLHGDIPGSAGPGCGHVAELLVADLEVDSADATNGHTVGGGEGQVQVAIAHAVILSAGGRLVVAGG